MCFSIHDHRYKDLSAINSKIIIIIIVHVWNVKWGFPLHAFNLLTTFYYNNYDSVMLSLVRFDIIAFACFKKCSTVSVSRLYVHAITMTTLW